MNEILKASALELAQKIKAKEVSPIEVLEAHISQIEKVNPKLNALIEDDFARARKTAQAQCQILHNNSASELPVFFGVPFTVKEMTSYEGMKMTGGSLHHRSEVSTWDGTVLERMKQAGAIPLGTSNVPELGFWFETENLVYGRTNNPYDLRRTSGGSSGGEGALIAAGASVFGLGSDIGGSIRIPAAYCGVFGHKPSRYLIPLTGHFPYTLEEIKNFEAKSYPFTSNGCLARRAEDLLPLLKTLAGPDEYDPYTQKAPLFLEEKKSWAGRKIFICAKPRVHLVQTTSDEQAQVVTNVGRLLAELGADVQELDPRFFNRSVELWLAALKSSSVSSFMEKLQASTQLHLGKEFLRLLSGKPQYNFTNLVVAFGEKYFAGNRDISEALAALAQMKADLDRLLGEDGLLIVPTVPTTAPSHRGTWLHPFDFVMSGIFTMTSHPATAVPMGLGAHNLPLSVQVVGPYWKDHLTIQLAEFLEQTFGGWKDHTPAIS